MGIALRMNKDARVALTTLLVLCLLPLGLHDSPYIMHILIMCLIWGVVAASWELTNAYAGIFNLAQMVFFIAGAYASAMTTIYFGVSPWLGLFIGGIVAGGLGLLIALPCMRIKGGYTALVTLALALIVEPLIRRSGPLGTGGSEGLHAIPPFQIGEYTFTALDKVPPYYLAIGIFCAATYVIYRVIHSKVGLAFVALRDAPDFGKSLGVSDYRYRLIVFGIAACLSGVVGAFYAHYTSTLSPTAISLDVFLTVLLMMTLGGGKFPGAIIAAFAITFLNESLRGTGTIRPIVLGAIIVSAIVLMPRGIMGIVDSITNSISRRYKKAVQRNSP